ncbi:hypothetical protein GCM10011360_01650 [Primorskyibacter flagellatus]|uniref:Uncharacterized protein n=1 Tax=Primorskyibacter flagellatus TaxID=1387277 RepID=A0A916ZY20_9RHOB|nr:hypothetical protein GCM10011360_01650 [Primorskyibacter flagellatus]
MERAARRLPNRPSGVVTSGALTGSAMRMVLSGIASLRSGVRAGAWQEDRGARAVRQCGVAVEGRATPGRFA